MAQDSVHAQDEDGNYLGNNRQHGNRIIHLDHDKNDLFVDLQEMRRKIYRVDASAQSHIFSPKYVSKTPTSGDEAVFVSEIPSQLTKLHLPGNRRIAKSTKFCALEKRLLVHFFLLRLFSMGEQDNTDSNRIFSSAHETWQEAWPPNARQATLGRKQLDTEWVLDFISDSDDDDFVTKKPNGKRARGRHRAWT